MKVPTRRPRSGRPNLTSLTLIAVLVGIVALIGIPLFSSSMASSPSNKIRTKNALGTTDQSSRRVGERGSKLESTWAVPGLAALAGTKSWFSASPLMPAGSETVELFAADCTTPKTAFSLGETVCAKTNGVDVTTNPGNYYMNWVDSSLNQTNAGTITQNPQFFLFVPPTAGGWKATIGRVSPADSSIIGTPPLFTVSNTPGISTYTPDCLTPKASFVLGNTVCATAAATGGAAARRRVVWIDPIGNARQVNNITSDPQSFSFPIPASQTSLVGDEIVDNRGKWKVNIISLRSSVVATTTFVVTDPLAASADLSAVKFSESSSVSAGSNTKFFISVYNNGPDAAVNAVLSDPLPANTTFYSITQSSGSGFTCTTPNIGSAGTVSCTIASLPRDTTAQFELTVQVSSSAATNSVITNTATVSSGTADANSDNDSSSASVSVSGGGGGGGTCTLTCPANISAAADTTENGQPGAIVHFDPPSAQGSSCGTVSANHCNDCFFPVGQTVVSFSEDGTTGDSCSFTVTVTEGAAPTITCPSDKTATANSNCEATVDPGSPTTTGSDVTVTGSRSDGRPLSDPYPAGTTTITWTATNSSGTASCQQTITVNDTTAPTIDCPANMTTSTDAGQCSATVNPGTATAADNCGAPTVSGQRSDGQALNAPYPKGMTTITWTATDDAGNSSSCTQTITVNDTENPAITCPANISTNTDAGVCSASVDPGTPTATDNCPGTTVSGSRSDGQALTAPYPKGTTTITWTATDASGNHSSCTQTITVVDNQPPVIVFNGQTPSMWPPNHKYQTFQVTNFVTSVTDNCDSISVSSVVITKVTSDEIENGNGDGNTMNDIVIAANCKSVQLRSEREGNGNGRVYTIFFSVTDAAGNTGSGTTKVVVPHNPGETAVDNGPHYTVTSNCP